MALVAMGGGACILFGRRSGAATGAACGAGTLGGIAQVGITPEVVVAGCGGCDSAAVLLTTLLAAARPTSHVCKAFAVESILGGIIVF